MRDECRNFLNFLRLVTVVFSFAMQRQALDGRMLSIAIDCETSFLAGTPTSTLLLAEK
jgi:hypothetical protein